MTSDQTLAVQLLASAGVAWLAATLTARLSLERFRRERIWERKADAYTAILEALFSLFEWYDKHLDTIYDGRDLSEREKERLRDQYHKAKVDMNRVIEGQVWLLDPKVGAAILEMNRVLNDEYPDWHSDLEFGYGAVKKAREAVAGMARLDLEIGDGRSRWARLGDVMNSEVGIKRQPDGS